MAKSPEDKIEFASLAEAFDKAWREKNFLKQPDGSITAVQYSKAMNIKYFTARRRLEEMVSNSLATKSKTRHHQSFCYFLK